MGSAESGHSPTVRNTKAVNAASNTLPEHAAATAATATAAAADAWRRSPAKRRCWYGTTCTYDPGTGAGKDATTTHEHGEYAPYHRHAAGATDLPTEDGAPDPTSDEYVGRATAPDRHVSKDEE